MIHYIRMMVLILNNYCKRIGFVLILFLVTILYFVSSFCANGLSALGAITKYIITFSV